MANFLKSCVIWCTLCKELFIHCIRNCGKSTIFFYYQVLLYIVLQIIIISVCVIFRKLVKSYKKKEDENSQ